MLFLRFQFGTSNLGFDANAYAKCHRSDCPDHSENSFSAPHSGYVGCRPRPTLRRCDKKPEQSRQAKRKPVSFRFHIPTFTPGTGNFGVPDWNLKAGARRPSLFSLCFHRARRCHAFQCAPQFARRAGKRRDHAYLRSSSRNARNTRRIAPPFVACWKHPFQRKYRSDFTQEWSFTRSLPILQRQV